VDAERLSKKRMKTIADFDHQELAGLRFAGYLRGINGNQVIIRPAFDMGNPSLGVFQHGLWQLPEQK
jgi:hypothetical protein